jgi:hypothetical protein
LRGKVEVSHVRAAIKKSNHAFQLSLWKLVVSWLLQLHRINLKVQLRRLRKTLESELRDADLPPVCWLDKTFEDRYQVLPPVLSNLEDDCAFMRESANYSYRAELSYRLEATKFCIGELRCMIRDFQDLSAFALTTPLPLLEFSSYTVPDRRHVLEFIEERKPAFYRTLSMIQIRLLVQFWGVWTTVQGPGNKSIRAWFDGQARDCCDELIRMLDVYRIMSFHLAGQDPPEYPLESLGPVLG